MKKLLISLFCAMVAVVIVACGDDNTAEVVKNHYDSIGVLEPGKKLNRQLCDSTNAGDLIFVKDSDEIFLCNGTKWLSLAGADGEKGEKGEKGETGDKGAKGAKGDKGETGDDGARGEKGAKGSAGEDGIDGNGCQIVEEQSGVVTFACGKDTSYVYKNLCGAVTYDPSQKFCVNGKLFYKNSYFIDERDNHVYRTVTVVSGKDTATWMAENLNYDYNVGTASSRCFGGNIDYCAKYGRLYTWSAAVDSAGLFSSDCKNCGSYDTKSWVKKTKTKIRGVCPEGWHLPDTLEYTMLRKVAADSVYENESGYMVYDNDGLNLRAEIGWTSESKGEDKIGFSALPSGYCTLNSQLSCVYEQVEAYFMVSDERDYNSTYSFVVYGTSAYLDRAGKSSLRTVRCVKD